jgi:hypothetical protein
MAEMRITEEFDKYIQHNREVPVVVGEIKKC